MVLAALSVAQAAISMDSPQPPAAGEFTVQTALAAAEKGDPKAQYLLAKRHAKGDGLPRDYAKAAEYHAQGRGARVHQRPK